MLEILVEKDKIKKKYNKIALNSHDLTRAILI